MCAVRRRPRAVQVGPHGRSGQAALERGQVDLDRAAGGDQQVVVIVQLPERDVGEHVEERAMII